jgi:hypothetical protein
MALLRAGIEIDAYCTRCRMDLTHRIIAVVRQQAREGRVPHLLRHPQLQGAEVEPGSGREDQAAGASASRAREGVAT